MIPRKKIRTLRVSVGHPCIYFRGDAVSCGVRPNGVLREILNVFLFHRARSLRKAVDVSVWQSPGGEGAGMR